MNKQKISLILLSSLLLIAVFAASLNITEAETVTKVYDQSTRSSLVRFTSSHPAPASGGSNFSAVGSAITPSSTGYLNTVQFYLSKEGSPTGFLRAAVYNCTGTRGTDATPDTLIETSTNSLSTAYLSTSTTYNWHEFVFSGDTTIENGEDYFFMVYVESTSGTWSSGATDVCAGVTSSDVDGNANYARFDGYITPDWDVSTFDTCLRVYITDTANPTPTPAPTASPAPTTVSDVEYVWNGTAYIPKYTVIDGATYVWDGSEYVVYGDNAGVQWINDTVPFIVPMVLLFGGGFLGWYLTGRRGFWGFFAGLNAAAIIAYAVMPTTFPLWAIIALVLVDAILVFSAVRNQGGGE